MTPDTDTSTAPKVVALDGAASKFQEWLQAEADLKAAQLVVDRLKDEFRSTLRTLGADIGTIHGVPVLKRTTTKTFRTADFTKARPDLVEQYTRVVAVDKLDVEALRRDLPKVHALYQSEMLKPDWKAFSAAVKASADSDR